MKPGENEAGKKSRRPSIKDVATLAGVSAQTVSRVSNGAEEVRPQTRQRVEEAMVRLGYVPNRAARSLRRGAFLSLGVVVAQLDQTGEALVTAGIVDSAEQLGYTVSLVQVSNPGDNAVARAVNRLAASGIDGLIIVQARSTDSDIGLLPLDLPVVVSDTKFMDRYSAVVSDQVQGSELATNYLLGLGHQTVHHVSGPVESMSAAPRTGSWRRALVKHGAVVPDPVVGDWSAESGYIAGKKLARQENVTAIYCANDEMAFGVIRAFFEEGISVPDEVSVVGFDDITLSKYFLPSLTSVSQDFRRIGKELVEVVVDQIQGHRKGTHVQRLIPCELKVRGSTARPAHFL